MKSVSPKPILVALTFVRVFVVEVVVDEPLFVFGVTGFFLDSVDATGLGLRRLGGLELLLVLDVLSFGREVRNAPRTPSSSCGATGIAPMTTEIQIIAKRAMLNLMQNSPLPIIPREASLS